MSEDKEKEVFDRQIKRIRRGGREGRIFSDAWEALDKAKEKHEHGSDAAVIGEEVGEFWQAVQVWRKALTTGDEDKAREAWSQVYKEAMHSMAMFARFLEEPPIYYHEELIEAQISLGFIAEAYEDHRQGKGPLTAIDREWEALGHEASGIAWMLNIKPEDHSYSQHLGKMESPTDYD